MGTATMSRVGAKCADGVLLCRPRGANPTFARLLSSAPRRYDLHDALPLERMVSILFIS
jgi:hypothetical protein